MAFLYGFTDIEFLADQPVEEVGWEIIREAIDRELPFYNGRLNAWLGQVAQTTILAKESFEFQDAGSMQEIDEDGNPYPTILQPVRYDVAYPIRGAADAMGTNRLSRRLMTVEQANEKVRQVEVADKRWLFTHLLSRLLTKESYNWLDRSRNPGYVGAGQLTIHGLANGDATVYQMDDNTQATDDHYRSQLNAIGAGADNPYPIIRDELRHHWGRADANIVVYIPDNLVTATKALPDFVEVLDPQIQAGSNERVLRGTINKGLGDEVIGRESGVDIVRMRLLPDNYMFAHVRGEQFMRMRQYPISSFQGLFRESHNVDGNHQAERFLRFAGFGVRNRTDAVVYQIGSATYTTPAAYTAPLAHAA